MLGEAFTILAVLEAQDKISKTIEKIDGVLDGFSETTARAAESAMEAGQKIDSSLLQTASGADAVELADARLASAQEKLTLATKAQADAEKALLDARANAASEGDLAAAADAVAAAQDRATVSATELKAAQDALGAATAAEATEAEIAAATNAVTEAQQRAALATKELTAAQEQQSALVAPEDIAKAATALTTAEKNTAKATDEATAAQERQASTVAAAAAANDEAAAATDTAAASQDKLAASSGKAAASSGMAGKAFGIAGLAVAAIGYESIKAAGNFQSMTQHLVTDAGESQKNLSMIRTGMLQIAAQTGTTTDQMAAGMYHIESAGYHGQAALNVLKVAAEGAKVGGADLDTIGQALTGTMNAFGKSAGTPVQMMNALIATVGQGDMKLQDLGSSLGNVAAIAGAAGLSYAQVGGAIATMTAQNVTAQRATQDLAHTISSLQNPTSVQTKEMQAMGLNSNTLSKNLGKAGLTGTLQTLTQAVAAHTKGGEVLISTYNASAQASADANTMIKSMSPSMATLAKQVLNGTISYNDYNTAIKAMSPTQRSLMQQFEGVANKTKSFNDLLKAGSPAAQTYSAAMGKMLGGTTGLNTALMLTGGHTATFNNNVKTIGDAAKKTGGSVDNWSKIQGTFNQKIDKAKASVEAVGIEIGMKLLPAVTKIAGVVANFVGGLATWIGHNQKLVGLIGSIVGGMVLAAGAIKGVALATKLWSAAQGFLNGLMAIFDAEEAATGIPELIILIAAIAAGVYYAYTHFKTFRDIVNDVGKAVVATWKAVSSFFVSLWHDITSLFSDSIHAVVGVVEHWYPLILAVLSGGILLVPALIFKYWSQISGFVEGIWNDVVNFTSAAWNSIAGFFTGVGSRIVSTLTHAWDSVMRVTSTIWNAITGFFKKWWPLLLVIFALPIATLIAIWNHFGGTIMSAAQSTWNAISGFFSTIWGGISSTAQSIWNSVAGFFEGLWSGIESAAKGAWNSIVSFIERFWAALQLEAQVAWNLIKSYIINPIKEVWAFLQPAIHTVESFLAGVWNSLVSEVHTTWNLIKQYIITPITSAWSELVHIMSEIESAVSSGLHGALKAVESVGSWFVSIGEDIVNGIIKGIENAGGALFSSLGNLASDALSAAKSFIESGSPSKLFAREVGAPISQGVAVGITANAHLAQKALKGMTTSLTATAHTTVTGGISLATAGAGLSAIGPGSGGGVNITVDLRGATAMSDGDFNKLATKVGNAITKQLPQAGLHMKMGVAR